MTGTTTQRDEGQRTSARMRAIVHRRYGGPEVLSLQEVDRPTPAEGEALVRVHATSINPYDWHFMRGTPAVARLTGGLRRPAQPILGADLAGTVTAVGPRVTAVAPGDEVFGLIPDRGCLAEHVAVPASLLTPRPTSLTPPQAAAVPLAALTALQGVRDSGGVGPGTAVLINGSSGGVGTFAVQIARALGAEVTAVCSGRNLELVRELGAAHAVDYTREDVTAGSRRFDVIVDNVGNRRLRDHRRVLRPDGRLVQVGPLEPMTHWLGVPRMFAKVFAATVTWSQEVKVLSMVQPRPDDLRTLTELIDAGEVKPVIERTYELAEAADAIRHVETGHARGKVVVTL